MMKPLDGMNLLPAQKQTIRSKTKDLLRRSTMIMLLILLCGAAAPTVIRFVYDAGKELFFTSRIGCMYYFNVDKPGCVVMEGVDNTDKQPSTPSKENHRVIPLK